MTRKKKIFLGCTLCFSFILLAYGIKIRPMVKEYKKLTYQKLSNIDENTFAKLENTKVYGKDGKLIGEVNSGSYQYSKISEISKYIQDGYIAVEDHNFKYHRGIDYLATMKAGIQYILKRGKATRGGSTITQQLIKNSFLTQEKSVKRKVTEFFLAPEIEKMYTKTQIMEYYCNSCYYGNRCYGIGNAASYYFHKKADELTLSESALLIGLSNNPSRYDPIANYDASIAKRNRMLKSMLDAEVITKTQYEQARKEKIQIARYRKNAKPENYQCSFAIYQATLELMKKNGFEFQYMFESKKEEETYKKFYQTEYQKYYQKLRSGGYQIYTSFDSKCQKHLQKAVDQNLKEFGAKKQGKYEVQGAAVSIDNESGEIVAVVGGRGTQDSFNRSYLAVRQPGSSIKPLLVYAPAFESGIYYPSKQVIDQKQSNGPSNVDHIYTGSRTVRDAVIHSTNTVAWNILQNLEVKKGLNYLKNLRFANLSYLDQTNASAALGGFTKGARVVDMARGFATLEHEGTDRENSCIRTIHFQKKLVLKHKKVSRAIYSKGAAYMMTDCMQDAVEQGTGKNAAVSGQSIAGKTGTTNDYKDAWFCGYSAYYTTAVWVGCDQPKSMNSLTGSTYPSYIFRDYMKAVHQGKKRKNFEMPESIYFKDGDLRSRNIDKTLQKSVFEKMVEQQKKEAKEAVEAFEQFTIQDVESAFRLDKKYQAALGKVEALDDNETKSKFRERVEQHYKELKEEEKKWESALYIYEKAREEHRIAQNQKKAREAQKKREAYERQQNIDLVEVYIARLNETKDYDDAAEELIVEAQEALANCRSYSEYEDLKAQLDQAVERIESEDYDA